MVVGLLPPGPHDGSPRVTLRGYPTSIPGPQGGVLVHYGSGLTDYGKKVVAQVQKTEQAIFDEAPHMQRLLVSQKSLHKDTSFQIAVTSDRITGKRKGIDNPAYDPATHRVTLPVLFSGRKGHVDDPITVIHESSHAVAAILAALVSVTTHTGEYRDSVSARKLFDISEHPLFADAYALDLRKIAPRLGWGVGLGHFFSVDWGGSENSTYNNLVPRFEVFAEASEYALTGKFERDKLYDNKFGPQFLALFPHSVAAVTKLHKDLETISRDNPDDAAFTKAVQKYLDKMPGSPDAYIAMDMFAAPQAAAKKVAEVASSPQV